MLIFKIWKLTKLALILISIYVRLDQFDFLANNLLPRTIRIIKNATAQQNSIKYNTNLSCLMFLFMKFIVELATETSP